ncbi:hypothetical protein TorRG33x02_324670 [Trema orientale]|uniref:Uncharacterized protein n=1 Tax=Trema orientale TaxID=63057 RepID=A0A2P5BDT5_TREOI|nr:hypothetical protein TorRG33x02_324670 [Trema orientale]
MRASNDETARRVEVEDGLLVQVLLRDHGLNDVLLEIRGDLIIGHGLIMLSRDEDGVDANRDHRTTVIVVLNGDLGLPVGPEPRAGPVLANLGEAGAELGGQDMAERHQFRGLIGGVAEHVALVTRTDLLGPLGEMAMDALGNVGALLLNVDEDLAVVGVEADVVGDEADGAAGVADDLLVVDVGLGRDLAEDHDHVGLGAGLAGHLAVRVLRQAGVEDRVRDLVAELVRVALVHGFGCEQEGLRHFDDPIWFFLY